jgi:hypothetical protein
LVCGRLNCTAWSQSLVKLLWDERSRQGAALLPISCDQEEYDANLVALPVERTEEFLSLLGQK